MTLFADVMFELQGDPKSSHKKFRISGVRLFSSVSVILIKNGIKLVKYSK